MLGVASRRNSSYGGWKGTDTAEESTLLSLGATTQLTRILTSLLDGAILTRTVSPASPPVKPRLTCWPPASAREVFSGNPSRIVPPAQTCYRKAISPFWPLTSLHVFAKAVCPDGWSFPRWIVFLIWEETPVLFLSSIGLPPPGYLQTRQP